MIAIWCEDVDAKNDRRQHRSRNVVKVKVTLVSGAQVFEPTT